MGSTSTKWILDLMDKVSAPLKNIEDNVERTTASTRQLNENLERTSSIDYYAAGEGIQALNEQLQSAVQPGITFQSELAEVEAIAGVTGERLEALGKKARASALQFGGKASESLNTYKTLLSRLGPDIAKSPEALEKMEHSVRILSKTMGGDTMASVDALTTAMLQYGVDLSDPIKAQETMARMMNVMAAGAKEGAAEVPGISAALKVAGVQASQSNVSFGASNAALQALAAGGKEGAEAGTALRNVLAKMAGEDIIPKEAADKLRGLGVDMSIVSDISLPFTERLRELKKAQGDATAIAQVFGVENAAAANILLNSIDAQEELKKKITGTNTASEQAAIVMDTYAEKMKRLKAWFSDLGISVFNATKSILPFVQVMGNAAFTVSQFGAVYEGLGPLLGRLNKKTLKPLMARMRGVRVQSMLMGVSFKSLSVSSLFASASTWTLIGSIKALSIAIKSIPVVGWILAIVGALITLFTYLWNNSEKFRGFIYGTWNVIKLIFGKIWAFISPILDWIGEKFVSVFSGIWNTVKTVFGNVWKFLKGAFNFIKNIISTALNTVSSIFSSIFGGVYDTVVGIFKDIWEKIKYYINLILMPIKKAGKFFGKLLGFDTGEISSAFEKGMARGDAEIETDEEKEAKKEKNEKKKTVGDNTNDQLNFGDGNKKTDDTGSETKGTLTGLGGETTGNGLSVAGTGKGGGGKSISMVLNIVNNFAVSAETNMRDIADELVGHVNEQFRDAAVNLG